MDDHRKSKLIAYLTKKDTQGLPFAKAKAELLQQGYTEAEIVQALYEAPYDGKPNPKPQPNAAAEHIRDNPQAADKVADALLKDIKTKERDKAIVYGVASKLAPGTQAQAHYEFRLFESLGLPYFKILLLGIVLLILSVAFHWPNTVLYAYGVIIGMWVVTAFIRRA